MNPVAKMLIFGGIILIIAGLVWQIGGKYINLGRLPGDIVVEKGNVRFYFPIVTCILISVVLTLIFQLYKYLR